VDTLLTPATGLASVAVAAFLAATVLPLSSEAALFAYLSAWPEQFWPAIIVATAANTAGGMTTYLLGRLLPARKPLAQLERVRRWGPPALVFAWLPVVGDGLVLAAGWLRANWLAVLLFQVAGRLARYVAVAYGAT
jgi:membrane protein YqaA with SNARE-associated domain